MKYFKYILFIVTSLACYSCIENDPDIENFPNEKVAFSYEVIGDYKVNAERKSKVDDNTAKMQSIKWLGV